MTVVESKTLIDSDSDINLRLRLSWICAGNRHTNQKGRLILIVTDRCQQKLQLRVMSLSRNTTCSELSAQCGGTKTNQKTKHKTKTTKHKPKKGIQTNPGYKNKQQQQQQTNEKSTSVGASPSMLKTWVASPSKAKANLPTGFLENETQNKYVKKQRNSLFHSKQIQKTYSFF